MGSKRLTPEEDAILKRYVSELPCVMVTTAEKHFYKGSELIEMGMVEDGNKIDPDKMYEYNYPVQIAANHYRRLKKAWLKHGEDGVMKYIKNIGKLLKQQADA